MPVDQLPLNERALAWAEFFDEPLSPMWDCASAGLPSLLGDHFPINIRQATDRVVIFYEHDEYQRTIWMNGRTHPPATDLFYKGHSIGWYEGDTLVVETTNFTFDPDGLDDHGHVASSTRKRLIERYRRTEPDSLEMEITVEDSLFLTEPFTWTRQLRRSALPPGEVGRLRSGTVQEAIEHTAVEVFGLGGQTDETLENSRDWSRHDLPGGNCAGSPLASHVLQG